jgi:aminopeptidase N
MYDWMVTEFEETPPMSTYLFAILVSDYDCLSAVARPPNNEVAIRVCARSNAVKANELDLALDASVKVSEFFEKYYGIKYPLSKLGTIFYSNITFLVKSYHRSLYLYFQISRSRRDSYIRVCRLV